MSQCELIPQPVFTRAQIAARVNEMGAALTRLYGEEALVAICVLKGAFVFFSDLVRELRNPNLELDFVRLSSYGKSCESSGHVIFHKDIEVDIHDKHVLIVEDIVDSGHTMRFLLDQFKVRAPRSIRVAVLIDKGERRRADVPIDISGFYVPGGFLVGYGLDCAERYRALPDIWEITAASRACQI